MPITFFPHPDDAQKGSLEERVEVLMEAAENYKAAVLDTSKNINSQAKPTEQRRLVPRDQLVAFNWEEISRVLREVRELPEGERADRLRKVKLLNKLADVYEVLRGAKMSKLEAVRLALKNEANQLSDGTTPTVTS